MCKIVFLASQNCPNSKFKTEITSFGREVMSNKFFVVFVRMMNKDLSHFFPYSILTGDGWIIWLECVKENRENVLLYIS